MSNERRPGPVEMLRNLALSLERLAAHEAASSVVRGTADGLRQEMPELEGQLRALLQDTLTVLGRLAHEAAEHKQVEPGVAAHAIAASATQGMLEVLEREWQDGGLPLHSFIERLNRLLDGVTDFAHFRSDEIRTPRERAQAITETMVKTVVQQLREELPALAEDLRAVAPVGGELAAKAGRGFVEGIEAKLRENPDPFGDLLENAGRKLVRGLAAGLREELASNPAVSGEVQGASLETLAELTAAATVRGVGGALTEQVRTWREALASSGTPRRMSRELTRGVLEALGAELRRPLLAIASAGGLLTLTLLSMRWRRLA
ncbi:hypothetical protein [Archangium violaceum]|uniref:Uncharacterized protein n=1 Tax=Archangium violaceum Cb vi76 TaxID=1406225 RepID=A0A084SYD7_9BACT|nr:hypothetical protein [Archangium violaceum]KFA93472.1 hypothetical protein Q664_09020 [Archangium violaceum Cb vi76]